MGGITGPFSTIRTSQKPINAHISHLLHLTNVNITIDVLRDRHGFIIGDAKKTARKIKGFVFQAIEFFEQSKESPARVKPVSKYYCYLNLAVATILAFRPNQYEAYKKHGVEDQTHSLNKVELPTKLIKANFGAVTLFHSIFSDTDIRNKKFSLSQTLSGIPMIHWECENYYGKSVNRIFVDERVANIGGKFQSEVKFTNLLMLSPSPISRVRIEKAIPSLGSSYSLYQKTSDSLTYRSIQSWTQQKRANKRHIDLCFKIINFGGHRVYDANCPMMKYSWFGFSRTALLPTLTCILLSSFAFASISRYRPNLIDSLVNSPMQLIFDTFANETDTVFLSSLRNLLFREEVAICQDEFE